MTLLSNLKKRLSQSARRRWDGDMKPEGPKLDYLPAPPSSKTGWERVADGIWGVILGLIAAVLLLAGMLPISRLLMDPDHGAPGSMFGIAFCLCLGLILVRPAVRHCKAAMKTDK